MKFKKFLKENYRFLIVIALLLFFFYFPLPYYVMAPGGTINVTNRVEMEGYEVPEKGSLNMLYVSEYDATLAYLLYASLNNTWDIGKNAERKISDESIREIEKRNVIMRDNSLDIATMVAYREAGKSIEVKSSKNIVVATTLDNDLKVGDVILEVEGSDKTSSDEIKRIISEKEEGDILKFKVLRDEKEVLVQSRVAMQNNAKVIGVVIITEYDYETDPDINIKFKSSESGSSGGLMLTLTIYNAVSGKDIIRGRKIAGTGTISADGTVGEIDGVKYKIMGAYKDGADIVLVPSDNYEEAISTKEKYGYDIEIVEVDTFKDAVSYLENN